ncbi:AhpC/TSA antioxidant enzyme-domain-containing protein [Plectosphaerella plurivora]|uniref:AhpC/TSA antioxidant enzyme-domain-containing protein n=1 Tax=Plectosphaerella plurivora TaxID=936078 RepID=A0A9P8VCC8_9PEZI|nr:AhpC/TSA antioxidant enzyme-domain-containing protein [Plectosphaerella plurivora]
MATANTVPASPAPAAANDQTLKPPTEATPVPATTAETSPATEPEAPAAAVKNPEPTTAAVPETNAKETSPQLNPPESHTPPSVNSDTQGTDSTTKQRSLEIDLSHPEDFEGEISTSSELPPPELVKKLDNYVVLDRHGKTHTFKSLHSGRNVARRMLIIFVRHFYCGNCQDYLRSLSDSITTDALLGLPVNTFITVIGCGDPALIQMYAETTNCPFPIYTDPTRSLFKTLGMTRTWDMGEKPAYIKKSFLSMTSGGIAQGLKKLTSGLATKGGDFKQVGGEFLFEPEDLVTPISTPEAVETNRTLDSAYEQQRNSGSTHEAEDLYGNEEKAVTWCHRMRTTRDHAEIPELMEVLGLDGNGKPIRDHKRWTMALQKRKGTGLSMASQMSKMSMAGQKSQPV